MNESINFYLRPVDSSAYKDSKEQIRSVLDDYQLSEAFDKGKMYFTVDGGLYEAVVQMYVDQGLEPLVSICSPHNWGNASKRTLSDNLSKHWPAGPSTIEVIFIFEKRIDPGSIQKILNFFLGFTIAHK